MSDRLKQIVEKSPRVVVSLATPGYWRPAGTAKDITEGHVVARADLAWMVSRVENAEDKVQRLMDEVDVMGDRLESSVTRVGDLEEAIQRVLEADSKETEFKSLDSLADAAVERNNALRNLRSVWARA